LRQVSGIAKSPVFYALFAFHQEMRASVSFMFGSKTIFRLSGIPIRFHFTLGLAFLFLLFQWGAWGIPGGIILFASVLLHELGHALVAKRLGIGITSIDLHLLGGTAVMGEHPTEPADEIMIAGAGPLVSLLLAAAFSIAAWGAGASLNFQFGSLSGVLSFAAAINLMLGLFNLIPALPMDGGRILRGLLARKMGAQRATNIAARIARIIAIGLGVWSIVAFNISLALIAFFVYNLANQEEKFANVRAASERWTALRGYKNDPRMDGYIVDVSPEYSRR